MADIRGFIFDIDGTLVDSNDAHRNAWTQALEQLGYEVSREQIRSMVGVNSGQAVQAAVGLHPDDPAAKRLIERKGKIFDRQYKSQLKPFPEVAELLKKLREKGVRLAVASSATGKSLAELVRIAGADDELPCESCTGGRSKPDPEKVTRAARWLDLPAAQCVMVGDTPFDAQAARAASVRFVGLRCGGWDDRSLTPSIGVYDDPAHLLANLDAVLGRGQT
jgi:HAD superfamily hydrolase (TIGR01549 family)